MAIIHLNKATGKHIGRCRVENKILHEAQADAAVNHAKHNGAIAPEDAWKLFTGGVAHLVDIRSKRHRYLYGYVPNTFHVEWTEADIAGNKFSCRLAEKLSKRSVILLLNTQGKDEGAALAAQQATQNGFSHVFIVKGGYEDRPYADIIEDQHPGWRAKGLPWLVSQYEG